MSAVADPSTGARAGHTPSSLGFRMPAEWEPHERCIMGWPTQIRIGSVWNEHYLLAMASYAAVAHAIAAFEPVLMLARPGEGGDRAQLPAAATSRSWRCRSTTPGCATAGRSSSRVRTARSP